MYSHIGSGGVVHDVGDVVIVELCLPCVEHGVVELVAIGKRGDKCLCFRHVHVQGGVAHVGGTVIDESAFQHIKLRQPKTEVDESIHFPKLRE